MEDVNQQRSKLWTSSHHDLCSFSTLGSSLGPTWRAQTYNFTRTKCAIVRELKRKVIYFSSILSFLNAQLLTENMVWMLAHPPHAGLTARRAEGCQSVILPLSAQRFSVKFFWRQWTPSHLHHLPYFASHLLSHSFLWSKCASCTAPRLWPWAGAVSGSPT